MIAIVVVHHERGRVGVMHAVVVMVNVVLLLLLLLGVRRHLMIAVVHELRVFVVDVHVSAHLRLWRRREQTVRAGTSRARLRLIVDLMLHRHIAVVHADSVMKLAHVIMGMHVRVRWMVELSRWGRLVLVRVRLVAGEHVVVVVVVAAVGGMLEHVVVDHVRL